jgi:hypothetical protein
MARAKKASKRVTTNGATIGYEAKLWQMADALRGSMDAAEYKHVLPCGSSAPGNEAQSRRKLRDSSRTRVAPLFRQLEQRDDDWPLALLDLAAATLKRDPTRWEFLRMSPTITHFGDPKAKRKEKGYAPSKELLTWLVRNLTYSGSGPLSRDPITSARRQLLLDRDVIMQEFALESLKIGGADAKWCQFEGTTYPDAVIETPDAIIVVEGKRTESGPTTKTTWMSGRHQMLRHIDGAFNQRGLKDVFGLFIVEGDNAASHEVPNKWMRAAYDTISWESVEQSLPHRAQSEKADIVNAFVGVTTWLALCRHFNIPESIFPDTVQD